MAGRIVLGNLTVDRDRFEVWIEEKRAELTYVEFVLLFCLARSAGKVVQRERLVEAVWGDGETGGDRKLRVHISRLRKKIAASHPWRINTVTKRGYSLSEAVHIRADRLPSSTLASKTQPRTQLATGG